jgi:hypothetical protein
VGRLGLEPRTHGLKVRCSTIELTPRGQYSLAALSRGAGACVVAVSGERVPRESAPINMIRAADKWTDYAGDRTQIIRFWLRLRRSPTMVMGLLNERLRA